LTTSVNCASCGQLNPSTAEMCAYCQTSLEEFPKGEKTENKVIDLNEVKGIAAVTKNRKVVGNPSLQSQNSDWRVQLNLKLDRLREHDAETPSQSAENLLREIRDREFARPSRARSPEPQNESFLQSAAPYHPLVQRTLEKLNRASQMRKAASPPPQSVKTPDPLQLGDPSALSSPQTRKRRSPTPKTEKIERIEINLGQGALPFGEAENSGAGPWQEGIKKGLAPAALPFRIRAGAIDTLFICGCFLIFLMIVFFVPDFVFLSRSSFAGLAAVAVFIASGYLFLLIAVTGRTLGMDYEQLRVISFNGTFPSLKEVSLRSFGYFISLGCFGLGFLWAVFDPYKLTWHDRISKTLIIRKESPT
jgi:uncharacterized RDD family membrane protein YckC